MKYIPLILFLTASVGCQTLTGKKINKAEAQQDEKSAIRKLSHAASLYQGKKKGVSAMTCKCTGHYGYREPELISLTILKASEDSQSIRSQTKEKCAEEILKAYYKGNNARLKARINFIRVQNCRNHPLNAEYIDGQ